MKLLEAWVQAPFAAAVGWTLIHSLWEGAVISAALAVALTLTRSSRARYAAACAAMLVMLAAFGVTLVRLMPEGLDGLRTARPAFPAWRVGTDISASSSPSYPWLAAAIPWLAPFWIAGVWIFYLRHLVGWISVGRSRRRGVCCAPPRWQAEIARLSGRLRLSRPILLLESCLADTPMVVGHFRPHILMPVGLLTGLPAAQIEAILLHELAHIRRCDYLVNVLQRSVEGLLFYHPAAWWISRVIRTEREHCCDDVVVATFGNAREYAVALAALEQNRWSGREPAVAATGGSLVKRIRRLLYPQKLHAWTPWLAIAVLAATAAAAMAAWPSQALRQSPAAPAQASLTATSAYDKWLNQDVVYIIADEERAAFQRLTTDREREHFIEQFWQRRDPAPGTAENQFKVEHYRRIAYANQHFGAASGRAGWQTDRGHMYIVYGPPDEIEAHPKGAQAAHHVWMYHHVEGVGNRVFVTFVDRTGTGDYRLAPGNAQ